MSTEYDEHYAAGGFQYEPRHQEWFKREVIDRFGLLERETILDAGCGDGYWTGLFAAEGMQATGIDTSEKGIRVASENHPGAQFIVADATRPLDLGRFNVVFLRNISPFLREDLQPATAMLRSLLSLLNEGGAFVVVQYSHRTGVMEGPAFHHPLSAYVRAVEPIADVDVDTACVVNDYVLIRAGRKVALLA